MPDDGLTLLISEEDLRSAVGTLAGQIDQDYASTGLVVVCVLKGATIFTADLLRQLKSNVHRLEFLRASSYGSGTESSGSVRVEGSIPDGLIAGQHVLIVDDIADTGHTCVAVTKYLGEMGPASLRYCTLLDKPDRREVEVEYDYVGFTIPNHFVVGYGMDLDERYRGLPAIYYFPNP
ncbi:MAG: hypoxanthine phosphoribosyltransferase [Chloroflexi bacterium]|nr:hypoxanthine phosphoribosyltransferase [Chloroflexota bacterium]